MVKRRRTKATVTKIQTKEVNSLTAVTIQDSAGKSYTVNISVEPVVVEQPQPEPKPKPESEAPKGEPISLFTTQTPTQTSASDGAGSSGDYELGMRFSSAVAGIITAVRYWKATNETGTHVGRIWSSSGQLLASVTFTGESASGWQTMDLATPLSVEAGAQYVVSVNATSRYAVTNGGFNAEITNGALTAPVGAGVFNEIPGSAPSKSHATRRPGPAIAAASGYYPRCSY